MPETPATTSRLSDRVERIGVSATLAVVQQAEKLRAQGVDLVDFGPGEPDFPTPEPVKQAAVEALAENFTKYTAAGGIRELREAICAWHARELGSDYSPAECIATVGGKHAVFEAVCALINPGDAVLLPTPCWVSFPEIIRYAGGRVVFVPTDEGEGLRLTAAQLARAWVEGTRLVIVNSPNNPTGAVLDRAEFSRILELVQRRGALLLSDECYSHFVYDSEPFSVASRPEAKPHVVIAGSLSKTFAMTGWRLGYALAPEPVIEALLRIQSHSTSNPTSFVQKAAIAALHGPMDSVRAMLAEYRERRARILEGLRRIPGLTCAEPQGAFYAYPNVSRWMRRANVASTIEVARRLLEEARVVVVPGEAFGTDEHIRLSYATSMPQIEEGLRRLTRFFSS